MAVAFQQQIFALDARFNTYRASNHPNFRSLYIRRRNQLLREKAKHKDIETIKKYIAVRTQLLQRKYSIYDTTSISSTGSRTQPNCKFSTFDQMKYKRIPQSTSENYAFSGVHHIFDQHAEQVSMVKFAHNDRSLVACASNDGKLSVCDVTSKPPTVKFILDAHSKSVTGFDWSASNELLVSCGEDGWIRLWTVAERQCLRSVRDQQMSQLLCCVFQPANNNMVITGNNRGMVQVLNVSTGIYPKGGTSILGGKILSISCDSSGRIFWAGNNKGIVISYGIDAAGRLSKLRRCIVGGAVTNISWTPWLARQPALLINAADNSLYLFRITDREGSLILKQKFSNIHKSERVRSTFCPIMSLRRGTCVVTGSEDSCVYFLDIEGRPHQPIVNKLQGHASPVLGVSFNYDESLLATSDLQGLVIIWRRN